MCTASTGCIYLCGGNGRNVTVVQIVRASLILSDEAHGAGRWECDVLRRGGRLVRREAPCRQAAGPEIASFDVFVAPNDA